MWFARQIPLFAEDAEGDRAEPDVWRPVIAFRPMALDGYIEGSAHSWHDRSRVADCSALVCGYGTSAIRADQGLAAKPTLLIWGDCDRAVGLTSGSAVAADPSAVESDGVPGVGHIPFEEQPDVCNQAMRDWLRPISACRPWSQRTLRRASVGLLA